MVKLHFYRPSLPLLSLLLTHASVTLILILKLKYFSLFSAFTLI